MCRGLDSWLTSVHGLPGGNIRGLDHPLFQVVIRVHGIRAMRASFSNEKLGGFTRKDSHEKARSDNETRWNFGISMIPRYVVFDFSCALGF